MYFEIFKQGNLIIRGKHWLGTLQFDHELNLAPTTTMVLPADWYSIISGREEIKIHLDDGKVFWGIIWNYSPIDKVNETITLDIRHVVTEWQYRQISVNRAMSNKDINVIFKGDKTNISNSNSEGITASDFTILSRKIKGMTLKKWIAKASAQAWSTANGDKVAITSVDTSSFKFEKDEHGKETNAYAEGTYKVIFSTAKGTKVSVDCEIVASVDYQNPRTKSNKVNNETVSARPFSVYKETGFDEGMVRVRIKAKAWVYRHKDNPVPIVNIDTNFKNEVGTYEATAYTAKGSSITVKIEVKEGDQYSNANLEPSVIDRLEDIYTDTNFAYPGWQIEWLDGAEDRVIDYVYSKQNKLDALTETVELTDDLWWRVGFWNEKKLQIGKFGEKKPYIISKKPSGKTNIRMITEPSIEPDLENVINVATVYSDKSDGGMTSLTLREVYMNPEYQKEGFPVVILHSNVNNERNYKMYVDQFPTLAPNNELEYAVLDEESIALESGTLIEGSYSFNDLSPFETDGKVISDKKRIRASRTVYHAVIKRLKQSRRSYDITLTTEHLPIDLIAGDRVRLLYDNKIWEQKACSNYWKKILRMDDFYYITRIAYNIDEYGNEWNELTLTKWLKIQRETANTQG